MRIEFSPQVDCLPPPWADARPLVRRAGAPRLSSGALPEDIAFLRDYGIGDDVLRVAARSARRVRVNAADALLREGHVTDTLYFYTLARTLGRAFVGSRPSFAPVLDVSLAMRRRRARLADGRWLMAPDAAARRLLLRAARLGVALPAIAITTPCRFAALLGDAEPARVAALASDALPKAAPHLSARGLSSRRLLMPGLVCGIAFLASAFSSSMPAGRLLTDATVLLFFASLALRLLACLTGLAPNPPERVTLTDAEAPTYSVLVPLFREAAIVPRLVENLAALDYPRAKLEVLFLVEEVDRATRAALMNAKLPAHMRVVTVPEGQPRTKPRALNAGLLLAQGEFVTVYDAEDQPDPGQLRHAAWRFRHGPADLACLQARLAIVPDGDAGMLTRLFAVEYAALFDLYHVGAARLGLPIALGGTSNHLRRSALQEVGGWDAYNVAEDADLGLRLARFGFKVGELSSTTGELTSGGWRVWFNQRRRWTKGWMQTALVLLGDGRAIRDFGAARWIAVLLLLTNLVLSPLLTPIVLTIVASQLARHGLPCPANAGELVESTVATFVLALGASMPIWCAYAGMRRRGLRELRLLPLVPLYQLLICLAAWGGLIDLLRRPHHWRKTPHPAPRAPATRSSPVPITTGSFRRSSV